MGSQTTSELELVIRVAAFAELGLALLPFRNSANIHNNGQHLPDTELCNLSTRLSCRSMEELPEAPHPAGNHPGLFCRHGYCTAHSMPVPDIDLKTAALIPVLLKLIEG